MANIPIFPTFDDPSLWLSTMGPWLLVVLIATYIGIILADIIKDKNTILTFPDGEYTWFQVLVVLGISSVIITIAILEFITAQLGIQSMGAIGALALAMGYGCREMLTIFLDMSTERIKAILKAMFGIK